MAALWASKLGLLAIGVIALAQGPFSEAPFNPDARRLGAQGEWRAEDRTTEMHGAAYRRALALTHLEAAEDVSETAKAVSLEQAERLLVEALQAQPMNPYSWTMLAMAHVRQGDAERGLEALRRSAAYAPSKVLTAVVRAELAARLRLSLTEADLDRLRADLALIERRSRGDHARLLRDSRYLRLVARSAAQIPPQ